MRHERTGASRGKEAGKNTKGYEEEGEDRRQTRGRKGLEAGEDIRQERTEGRRGHKTEVDRGHERIGGRRGYTTGEDWRKDRT